MVLLGLIGYGLVFPGVTINGIGFDAHTLLFASLALLTGYQCVVFAIFTKTFAVNEGLMPRDTRLEAFFKVVNLERGLIAALIVLVFGVALLLWAVNQWRLTGFGHLDYARTMRVVIPGATLTTAAVQTIFFSFFISLLGMQRR